MASKINKNYTANIAGILDIDNNAISIEVEDIENPVNLGEFFKEFHGKEVKISIAYKQEL